MNRRYFLPALAAGAVTRHTRAAGDRVNVAIIGVRGRGRALAAGFAKLPDASVEYLVDVDDRVIANATDAVVKSGGSRPRRCATCGAYSMTNR